MKCVAQCKSSLLNRAARGGVVLGSALSHNLRRLSNEKECMLIYLDGIGYGV